MIATFRRASSIALPAAVGLGLLTGCASVSRNKFEDCRLRLQAVQAENEQLRDVALNVRNQNRDMSMRAVEDSRRLRAQEEAIQRLEKSVMAYQDERDRTVELLGQLQSEVRTAAASNGNTTADVDSAPGVRDPEIQLASAAAEVPSFRIDRKSRSVRLAVEGLFVPDEAELTPHGRARVGEVSKVLATWVDPEAPTTRLELVGTPLDSTGTEDKARSRWLSQARLVALRTALSEQTGVAIEKIERLEANDQTGKNSESRAELTILARGRN